MNFKEIQNKIKDFGKDHPTYWGCALCGEAGEAANILKKIERDGLNMNLISNLSEELADVFIYTSLTAKQFKIDLEKAILYKLKIIEGSKMNEKELFSNYICAWCGGSTLPFHQLNVQMYGNHRFICDNCYKELEDHQKLYDNYR